MENEYQVPMAFKKSTFDFARFQKPLTKANSERASLLEPFIERLQRDARLAGYKPMSKPRICMLMAYIDTDDLYMFHQKLEASPCYGAIWNWYVVAKDLNKR